MGKWRYSSTNTDLSTRWRCGQLHTPAALPPGTDPQYPLDGRLGVPQSWPELCGEESLAPAGNRTLVAQPIAHCYTELSRLQ
jgi:hypothetical protein